MLAKLMPTSINLATWAAIPRHPPPCIDSPFFSPKMLCNPPSKLTTALRVLQCPLTSTVILAGGISPALSPILHAGSLGAVGEFHFILCILVEVPTEPTGGPEIAAGYCHHHGPVFVIGHLQPKICLQDDPALVLGDLDFPVLQGGR